MDRKILIIEDDKEFSDAVAAMLAAKGYVTAAAFDGKEGFEKAQSEKPDLILLDVMMTRKTEGFDVARQLKSHEGTSHIPVVMVTGIRKEFNLPFGFEPDAHWLPVKTVLEKPVKPEELLKAIEEILK
jgi:CheY-like chemotaxis protein